MLSYICQIGDTRRRNLRRHGRPYVGFQDLMAQVCRHWREAVLSEPLLWNFISISQRSHYARAETYLRRTGSLVPLHIELELGSRIYAGIEPRDFLNHLEYSWTVINRLIQGGASAIRWKSLIVSARWADVLFELMDIINIRWTPILQFISLKWDYRLKYYARDYENVVRNCCMVKEPISSLAPELNQPKLYQVELEQIPAGFIFERQLPVVFGLTHLKLTTAIETYPVSGIRDILYFNPRLESLALHNSRSDYDYTGIEPVPVRLQYLRSLSVGAVVDSPWGISILKMIDAPNVEVFEYFGAQDLLGHQVVEYVTTGLTEREIWSRIHDQVALEKRPIFTTLRTLKIGEFRCPKWSIHLLLLAFPGVTSLEINSKRAKVLSYIPRVLPRLRHLVIRGHCAEQITCIIQEREEAGLPLDDVAVIEGTMDKLEGDVPGSTRLIEYPCYYWDESGDEEPEDRFPPPPPNTEVDDLAPSTIYDIQGELDEIRTPGIYE